VRRLRRLIAAAVLVAAVALGCQATGRTSTIVLRELNGSGVGGTVTFTETGTETRVLIEVDPAGNPDMPSHIHPGTCEQLIPQPRFPLENVVAGRSETVVPATYDELFAGDLAVNLHMSLDQMATYTACVEIE
jgi:hypothetical protein